jgi:hypothetical protein
VWERPGPVPCLHGEAWWSERTINPLAYGMGAGGELTRS